MTTFGDNDRLAAQVAGLLSDAILIILSDVDGLYDGPPSDPSSKLIEVVDVIDDEIIALAQDHPRHSQQRGNGEQVASGTSRDIAWPAHDHRTGT